jgi:hypothetical protein
MIVQYIDVRRRQHREILGPDLNEADLRWVAHCVLADHGYRALSVYSQLVIVRLERGAHGMGQLVSYMGGIHDIHSPLVTSGTRGGLVILCCDK